MREATLPSLIEACKRLITADRRRVFEERGKKIAAANAQALNAREQKRHTVGMRVPISTTRMSAGDVERGQEQGLGAGGRRRRPAVEHRQVLSDDGRRRSCGGRFGTADRRRRGARAQETRPTVHRHSERRRSDVRAGRAVDGGASPHSAAAASCTTTAPITRK